MHLLHVRLRYNHFLTLILSLSLLIIATSLHAAPDLSPRPAKRARLQIPDTFGEVVYQTAPATASTIYIIANAHRSAISGANAAETIQAQIETFRIGEWLINQNRIDLLLPEGFFGEMSETRPQNTVSSLLDSSTLQAALADTSQFVNAELLLHKQYGIGLNQIEDRELYRHTRERLRSNLLLNMGLSPAAAQELAYLQRLRTATILQGAPDVVATAYQQGRISSPNAMLTIGLSHLDDLVDFLKAGAISIAAQRTASKNFPAQESELEFMNKQVGITVIIPRILLAEHHRTLQADSELQQAQTIPADPLPAQSAAQAGS